MMKVLLPNIPGEDMFSSELNDPSSIHNCCTSVSESIADAPEHKQNQPRDLVI